VTSNDFSSGEYFNTNNPVLSSIRYLNIRIHLIHFANEEYVIVIMATKENENIKQVKGFESWLKTVTVKYKKLSSCQRLTALCRLVDLCSPSELYEYSNYVTDLFRRDFISLLPAELVDHVLSFVDHESLLRACCVGIRMIYIYIESEKCN